MAEPFTARKWTRWLGGLAALGAGVLLVAILASVYSPYKGYDGPYQLIQIPRSSSVPQIAERLESQGIIRSARAFRWFARLSGAGSALKAGEYRFEGPISLADVVQKVRLGMVFYHKVTVPEGLTMDEIATLLTALGFGSAEKFKNSIKRYDVVSDLDSKADSVEGYLFPETYYLTRDMSEEEIIRTMVVHFRRIWTPERAERARELELSLREVITLASLIEKETGVPDERPLVSAVFQNRLRLNIKLACDPTVIYAVKQVKEFDGIIHQSDLRFDSPYNTYLYPGLPPGPIANPGLGAIDAALQPADVDYLYFVSKNDGTHIFSTRYRDHDQAVRLYQR